jgi:glutathione S-transferase
VTVFGAPIDHEKAKAIANDLLKVLEAELTHRDFAIGNTPTIADIAGYSYIAKAPEGGVSLEPYPAIRMWLKRIESLPGFVPFKETRAGLLAT